MKVVRVKFSQTVDERNEIGNLVRLTGDELQHFDVQTRAADVKTASAVDVDVIDIARFAAEYILQRANGVERAAGSAHEVVAAP